MLYNKWLTHSADSLEDNSPNLLEGILFKMTLGFFFCTFLSSADSLCIVSGSLGFSKSTELNGRNRSIVIAAGEMALIALKRIVWGGDATNLQFVENTVFVKGNTARHNKTMCAYKPGHVCHNQLLRDKPESFFRQPTQSWHCTGSGFRLAAVSQKD